MMKIKQRILENPIWSLFIITIIVFIVGPNLPNNTIFDIISILIILGYFAFLIRAIIRKIKNMISEGKIKKIKKEKEAEEKKIKEQEEKEFLAAIPEMIKNDKYPTVKVDIPLEKEEKAYGIYASAYIKEKKVTTRTNYGGMTGSIKIMKGMRYRLGSIQHQSESHIEEYRADVGILYVTNKRFIFKGDKQVVEIKAKDMMTMEVTGNFVKIFKKKGNAIKLEFVGEHSTFGAVMMGLNNKE